MVDMDIVDMVYMVDMEMADMMEMVDIINIDIKYDPVWSNYEFGNISTVLYLYLYCLSIVVFSNNVSK